MYRWKKHITGAHPMWVRERTYVLILCLFISGVMASAEGIQLLNLKDWVTCYGCDTRNYAIWVFIIILIICVVIGVAAFCMWDYPDPYAIKPELIACLIVWVLVLIPYFVLYTTVKAAQDYLGLLIFVFIAVGYLTSVVWPIYTSFKAPPETEDNQFDSIIDLIRDPDGLSLVSEIARMHHCEEASNAVHDILKYMDIEDETKMRRKAQRIYEKYVKESSATACNLAGPMRDAIARKIGNPKSDTFNLLYQEMCKLLQTNFMNELKKHHGYKELLDKKKAATNTAGESTS
jgi:hypothetical protein